MRYLVVVERAGTNYSAYLPDVPGCVATGKTPEAARRNIESALKLHAAGLREDGLALPEPSAQAEIVELA